MRPETWQKLLTCDAAMRLLAQALGTLRVHIRANRNVAKEETMSDKLDAFVQQMQSTIDESVQKDWGEAVYSRWKDLRHLGPLPQKDAAARLQGSCGDSMEIELAFNQGRVSQAAFQTDGCGPSQVCGSLAAELAHGKPPEELLDITGQTLLDILGGLPEEYTHCAYLAAATLHAAVDTYMQGQNSAQTKK